MSKATKRNILKEAVMSYKILFIVLLFASISFAGKKDSFIITQNPAEQDELYKEFQDWKKDRNLIEPADLPVITLSGVKLYDTFPSDTANTLKRGEKIFGVGISGYGFIPFIYGLTDRITIGTDLTLWEIEKDYQAGNGFLKLNLKNGKTSFGITLLGFSKKRRDDSPVIQGAATFSLNTGKSGKAKLHFGFQSNIVAPKQYTTASVIFLGYHVFLGDRILVTLKGNYVIEKWVSIDDWHIIERVYQYPEINFQFYLGKNTHLCLGMWSLGIYSRWGGRD